MPNSRPNSHSQTAPARAVQMNFKVDANGPGMFKTHSWHGSSVGVNYHWLQRNYRSTLWKSFWRLLL